MKRLLAILALLSASAVAQQSGYAWPPVDVLISQNGQTLGAAVSNTTLASGTLGTYSSISSCPNNATTMYVGANIAPLGASVQVLGSSTIYPANTSWPAVYYNNSVTLENCFINVSGLPQKMNIAVLRAFGPPNASPSGKDYDELRIDDNNDTGIVLYAVAQLQNGNCPASLYGESSAYYGIEIETRSGSGGAVTHTNNCIYFHYPYSISSTSESGTTATYTTSVAHGFTIGEPLFVTGVGVSGYNTGASNQIVVLGCDSQTTAGYVCTSTTFTATLATSGLATSSGGTVTPVYIENLQVDGPNNLVSEALFNDFPPYAQIGNTITSAFADAPLPGSGWGLTRVLLGNIEAGNDGGVGVFQNYMVQYTNPQFPLVPQLWNGVLSPQRAVDWTQAGAGAGVNMQGITLTPQNAAVENFTLCQSLGVAGQSSSYVQSVTAANINSALSTCDGTDNSYVYLNPGTYQSLGSIIFPGGATKLALRGAGANQTLLQFTSDSACEGNEAFICVTAGDNNGSGSPTNLTTWIAGSPPGPVGYSQGSNFINLTAVTGSGHSGLIVGNPIILDQCDSGLSTGNGCTSGTITDNGSYFVTTSTSTGNATGTGLTGPYSVSGNLGNAERVNRSQQQIVIVTQCDGVTTIGHTCTSPTNIGIYPGLYDSNWSAAQNPEAWWASSPAYEVGVEDLSIDGTGDSTAFPGVTGIDFVNCSYCWRMGVRSIETGYAHFNTWWSDHVTSNSNYEYLTKYWTTQGYGVNQTTCNNCLFENDISQAVVSPFLNSGSCEGSVYAYNFAILDFGQDSTYNFNSHGDHTAGTANCLDEGENGSLYLADLIHGTHNNETIFRSRYSATMPVCWISSTNTSTPDLALSTGTFGACTYFGNPIALDPFSRNFNLVANVLGNGTWAPFNTSYKNTSTENNYAIYRLGAGYDGIPTDANVPSTTLIYGNVDIQNSGSLVAEKSFCGKSTNTGWNSNVTGYRNCSATSEVPTGLTGAQQPYYSSVPQFGDTTAGQDAFPTSMYYTAKPSWWPSGKAWPLIGPDVSSGNISGTGGYANTNPAHDCYTNIMGGPSNGVGTALSYNRVSCYTAGGSFSGSPTTVPAHHSGGITVTLSGLGTSWTGSTNFTVSGVTGTLLSSSTNNSATSQTLVITTGSGTGTLTIADTTDSLSSTISVALATLSVSPNSGSISTTPSVTLTGTNTLWLSETASTLFSVSGGSGASLGTPTVTSNTSATATLTVGSATGTLTLTDNSTTATTTFTATVVSAVPAPAKSMFAGSALIGNNTVSQNRGMNNEETVRGNAHDASNR